MKSNDDLIASLVQEFSARLAAAVERFTSDRISKAVDARRTTKRGRPKGPAPRRARRGATTCYYPGCKNVAAPRFGMFCAAKHKELPKAEKERYRKARLAGQAKLKGRNAA